MEEIDASALQILAELVFSYQERGVGIYFAHLSPSHLDKFNLVGIPELVSIECRPGETDASLDLTTSTQTSAARCSKLRV